MIAGTPIYPMHRSMLGSQAWKRPPTGMSAMNIPDDLKHDLSIIALSVFTDCVNAGKTFQDAILAVYVTGLENGVSAGREDRR